jgi:hypothetical protein
MCLKSPLSSVVRSELSIQIHEKCTQTTAPTFPFGERHRSKNSLKSLHSLIRSPQFRTQTNRPFPNTKVCRNRSFHLFSQSVDKKTQTFEGLSPPLSFNQSILGPPKPEIRPPRQRPPISENLNVPRCQPGLLPRIR